MNKLITFTKSDLKKKYGDIYGCPIYSAMKRAGIPIDHVGGTFWSQIGFDTHDFSKVLTKVSTFLAKTSLPSRVKARQKLIGKSFRIAWLFLLLMVMGGCRVEGVFLDKAYRICRGHDGIQSVNVESREVACRDGLVKNFRTRSRG